MRRGLAVVLVLLLAAGGYAGLDIEDRVPGILTLDPPPARPRVGVPGVPRPGRGRHAGRARPAGRGGAGPPLAVAGTAAPLPAAPALATVLAPALADPGLGSLRRRDGPRRGHRARTCSTATPSGPASRRPRPSC